MNPVSKQMEASLVFSNMTKQKPVSQDLFENFNSKVIEELEEKNSQCNDQLISRNIEILKYINQTITLNNTVENIERTVIDLSTQIQTFEDQVSHVKREKETTVSAKEEEIKEYAVEKIELEEQNRVLLYNKFLLEKTLRMEINAKDFFIKGLQVQVQALEETIKVLNKMLSSSSSGADSTTAEISKKISKQSIW